MSLFSTAQLHLNHARPQRKLIPLITLPVLSEMASVQKRSNSSLANSIRTLLDPSRSPPGAALQGQHQGLSLRDQLGARDAKVLSHQHCPLGPAQALASNVTFPYRVLPPIFGLHYFKGLRLKSCTLGPASVWGALPLLQIPEGASP